MRVMPGWMNREIYSNEHKENEYMKFQVSGHSLDRDVLKITRIMLEID